MKYKKKEGMQKPRFIPQAESADLGQINTNSIGEFVVIKGIIDKVAVTAGPTLFSISDGTGTLVLKGFDGPGTRAHPEIVEGDTIIATVKINEFNGSLEGEIKKIAKQTGDASKKIKEQIEDSVRQRVTPPKVEFLIKSPILDKLKNSFIAAATEIRLAVVKNRPIIVRHHNDADGYSAGFALERAIIPLIEKQHGPGKAAWEFYTRAPCAAPFYEIEDSIKDTSTSLRNEAKFANKMPLIIIADNGSSEQDLMAIKQGKIHGIDFIVVDHHFFEEDVITSEVLVHINPFLVGEDGSHYSAGMLCVEFARFINDEVENITQISAMAGLADRIKNPEAMDAYIKLAAEEGYTKELLNDIATVIDFVSAKLRFMEAREYIEVLFGEPRDQQKELVSLLSPYIRQMEAKGLEIARSSSRKEKIGKSTLQILDIETTFPRGFYPKPGKCTGILHDDAQQESPQLVTIGLMSDAITIRATDPAGFSVHELIEYLHKHLPSAFVGGGGHKNAGSITFIPNKKEEVMHLFREYMKKNTAA